MGDYGVQSQSAVGLQRHCLETQRSTGIENVPRLVNLEEGVCEMREGSSGLMHDGANNSPTRDHAVARLFRRGSMEQCSIPHTVPLDLVDARMRVRSIERTEQGKF
jgi:hypothetical protein